MALLGRMEARAWKADKLLAILEYIKRTVNEVYLIQHLRTCWTCQMEAQLTIERYAGRGLPWFLDLSNGDLADDDEDNYWREMDPRFKDAPKVRDYYIGSYWEDVENARRGIKGKPKETGRFIEARIKWAEKINRENIVLMTQYYKQLNQWDLNGEPPPEPPIAPF